jgi:hypothetical protein
MLLVVELGALLLVLSCLVMHHGIFHHVASPAHHPDVGDDAVDDLGLKFFIRNFMKEASVTQGHAGERAAGLACRSASEARANAQQAGNLGICWE